MATITPRWEWRSFAESFVTVEEAVKKYPLGNQKKTTEQYILSRNSNENVKICAPRIDVKSLKNINDNIVEDGTIYVKNGRSIQINHVSLENYINKLIREYSEDKGWE